MMFCCGGKNNPFELLWLLCFTLNIHPNTRRCAVCYTTLIQVKQSRLRRTEPYTEMACWGRQSVFDPCLILHSNGGSEDHENHVLNVVKKISEIMLAYLEKAVFPSLSTRWYVCSISSERTFELFAKCSDDAYSARAYRPHNRLLACQQGQLTCL